MSRRLITLILSPWAAAALLGLVALAAAIPQTPTVPVPEPPADLAVRPLADDGIEVWKVAPVPQAAPAPRAVPEEAPDVDWNSLSGGVAPAAVAAEPSPAEPAGPTTHLSPSEARALLAEAEERAAGPGMPPGVGVVIGRGTPAGGSHGGVCKLRRGTSG